MIEQLLELDKDLFLYLNGFHTPWLDPVMLFLSEKLVWLPLYIWLLYLVIKDFGKESLFPIIGIALTILIADQVASTLMKPYFARLRPSHDPELQAFIHIVNGERGGKFGFASSHAANTFGLATFFFMLFGKAKKWVIGLFLWAAVVTYSRVYLGVHYPGDILVGGIIGILAGIGSMKFSQWLRHMYAKRKSGLSDSAQ